MGDQTINSYGIHLPDDKGMMVQAVGKARKAELATCITFERPITLCFASGYHRDTEMRIEAFGCAPLSVIWVVHKGETNEHE